MCGCIAVSCLALGLQTPAPAYAAVLGLTIVQFRVVERRVHYQ